MMKPLLFIMPVAAALIVFGCTPKPAPDKEQVLTDSLITVFGEAISAGDLEKTMNCCSDDILVLDMGTIFSGKDTLRAHMEPLIHYYKNFTFHQGLSSVNEDLVTYNGLFSLDWAMGEKPLPVRGIAILVWQKQPDNQWKLILEKLDFGMVAEK